MGTTYWDYHLVLWTTTGGASNKQINSERIHCATRSKIIFFVLKKTIDTLPHFNDPCNTIYSENLVKEHRRNIIIENQRILGQ